MFSGGFGPDGKVYCKHKEEAAKRKSNTPMHPNREFYCCKRIQSDPGKCDFWYWADRLPRRQVGIVHASSWLATSPPPSPPKKEGTSTSPIVPSPVRQSREHSVLSGNSPETPRSRKRLEAIEAGLRQREEDSSPSRQSGPSKEPSPPSPGARAVISQSPSPVPTEVDCEEDGEPPQAFRSFLGLVYSPGPSTSGIEDEGRPGTPKKRRLTPPAADDVIQPASTGGLPPTPPQTKERGLPLARTRKGKERASVPPVQTRDQDDCSGKEDCLPLFTLAEEARSTSSVSPTTAENVVDYADGVKARVKALMEYMDSFDVEQAGRLLQTMERQRMQYECRDRRQKERISELIAERDSLAKELASLR